MPNNPEGLKDIQNHVGAGHFTSNRGQLDMGISQILTLAKLQMMYHLMSRHFTMTLFFICIIIFICSHSFCVQPGIADMDNYFDEDEDVETRMAIPNEMEIRMSQSSNCNTGARKVKVLKDPSNPPTPTLPFKPRGLQWRGQPAITTRQLLAQLEAKRKAATSGVRKNTT